MLQLWRGEQRERDGDVDDDGRLPGTRPHAHGPGMSSYVTTQQVDCLSII